MPELQIRLADVHELVGDYEQARALYEAVRTATGDLLAWRGLASTLRKQGRFDEALALLAQAPPDTDDGSLQLEQAWTLSAAGQFEEAISVVENALTAAGDRRDTLVGHLLLQRARAQAVLGRADPRSSTVSKRCGSSRSPRTPAAWRPRSGSRATPMRRSGSPTTPRPPYGAGSSSPERVGSVDEIGGCL